MFKGWIYLVEEIVGLNVLLECFGYVLEEE